jgi:hypothetical protein
MKGDRDWLVVQPALTVGPILARKAPGIRCRDCSRFALHPGAAMFKSLYDPVGTAVMLFGVVFVATILALGF